MVNQKQEQKTQMVRDRKTGEWYDPIKRLDELCGLIENNAK